MTRARIAKPWTTLGSPIHKWRLYYVGDSTFDDTQGEPWNSPALGVIGVGQPRVTAARDVLINGHAFLYRTDWDCWMEVDNQHGFNDQCTLYSRYIVAVRFGLWIRRDEFVRVMRRIRNEVDASKIR